MNQPINQTQPAADPNAPLINPQAVYIKDCSFEAPTGPFMGGAEGSPTVNLNLATRANAMAQDMHEVVLQVNLEAKVGDRTVWLLELQQAGAFTIRNLSTNDLGQVLSIVAPNYLLSFARSTIADTALDSQPVAIKRSFASAGVGESLIIAITGSMFDSATA